MATAAHVVYEKRPGVFVFRNNLPRGKCVRAGVGWALAALLLQAAALLIRWWPTLSGAAKDEYAPLAQVISVLPMHFAIALWIVPQSILRISPSGIRWANTHWACFPRTRRRRYVRWSDITQLRWRGVRSEFRTGGRKKTILCPVAGPQAHRAIALALETYLSQRFDLTEGTVDERLRRKWKAWNWKRWLLDKLELALIGCGLLGYFAIIGYWHGHVLIPMIGLLAFLGAAGVVIVHHLRESRFGWEEARETRAIRGAVI